MLRASIGLALVLAAASCRSGAAGGTPSSAPSRVWVPTAQHGFTDMTKIAPSPNYPLSTCVVSGKDLDSMGGRIAYSFKGSEVQFCCAECLARFRRDPDSYLLRLPPAAR